MDLHTIGIDLGKRVFHLVGLNQRGEVVVRKKFSRKQPNMSPPRSHRPKELALPRNSSSRGAPTRITNYGVTVSVAFLRIEPLEAEIVTTVRVAVALVTTVNAPTSPPRRL